MNIHKSAHKMLQDAQYNNGSGLDNETKVQYFCNGIKYEAGIEVALSMQELILHIRILVH